MEIIWASGFKYDAVPMIVVIISLLVSFDLIVRATKVLPVGTTYAVFAGIGTVGMVVVEAVARAGDRARQGRSRTFAVAVYYRP
ncbi:DMT family transporter [Cohnella faecalis]|uniref:DMT family transporter n=1 Tax=Cohnella faecalis TaxID=2315694 RepID=UPI001F1CC973|nr:SMR family transporter [Cohnella faecalis]